MALARCEVHAPKPGKHTYVKGVPAAGKGLVCGSDRCSGDAQVWLTATELKDYQTGETVFSAPSASAKFRVRPFSN
jgi:hypothetical protein